MHFFKLIARLNNYNIFVVKKSIEPHQDINFKPFPRSAENIYSFPLEIFVSEKKLSFVFSSAYANLKDNHIPKLISS